MIRNSYQIFNCNEIDTQFKILRLEDVNTTKRINGELNIYHKNNNFDIQLENKNINEQTVINNKFVFKEGYFFCSYLYKEDNSIYISEPTFEAKSNPICSPNAFTNIVIKNRIPLNLKIVGVVYYYKTLLNKNECKTDMLYDENKIIVHNNSEKYIIDIVYFNSLIHNINYELSYMYYKNINYEHFIKNKFKSKLRYYYFNRNNDETFNKLSTTIETRIYEETNKIILNINNTRKKTVILQNLKKITYETTNSKSLLNLLSIITKKYSNNILDCNTNIYGKHLIRVERILIEINNIIENVTKFLVYNGLVKSKYNTIFDAVYNLPDFSVLLNIDDPSTFTDFKNIFAMVIKFKGDETKPSEETLYGLKSLIFDILDKISENRLELNNNIILLSKQIGTTVEDNNVIINEFLTTVQEYIKMEIDMSKVNEDKPVDSKLEILMKYEDNICTVLTDKILDKYRQNVKIDEDYNINELPDISNLLQTLVNFKINKNNIAQIYTNIDTFYKNLDTRLDDIPEYKTLYDIFFIKRDTYEEYVNEPHRDFKAFIKPFILNNGAKIQLNYNRLFKVLPSNDEQMIELNKNKKNGLEKIKESVKTQNILNIEKYVDNYSLKILTDLKKNYELVKQKIIFSADIITNICKTNILIEQYKKNIEQFIQTTKFDMNSFKAQRKSKNLENLPSNYRKGIEDFINTYKILFSTTNKYITDTTYNISNNSYNVIIKQFNKFINLTVGDEEISIDDLDLINVYFTLKKCIKMEETDYQSKDDFIVLVYSLCISVLSEYPKEFLDILFNMYNTNNDIKKLFDNELHNKLYLYRTKKLNIQEGEVETYENNIKLISSIGDINISDNSLNINNIVETTKKINYLKLELIRELKNERFVNIRKKLLIIQNYIGYNSNASDIDTIKLTTNRGEYSKIEKYYKNLEKMTIINNNKDINNIIKLNNYYTIKNKKKARLYCIDINKNQQYQCGPCDNTNRNALLKLRTESCPPNLPYNLDTYIDSHIHSELGFNKDTYRIMSFISEPNKELIYKNNSSVKYGKKSRNDSFVWQVNKEYKSYTLLDKTDNNPDETVIIKALLNNIEDIGEKTNIVTPNIDKMDKNNNEFYLNNFYIENIVVEDLKNEEWIKFPNSHQLYIQKPTGSNYYYVYFIENDIKYYMYLYVKKNKSNYDIIFRENTSRFKVPFILNNSKWRFIRTDDYIDNIFENTKILYNIRSKIYFNKSLNIDDINRPPPHKIRGLLAKDNTCDTYETLLNNFFNSDTDLINNTKFKFEGYNNNYKITPYVKSKSSIFNNIDGCLFLNYNTEQKKLYQQKKENKEITEAEFTRIIKNLTNFVQFDSRPINADEKKKLIYYKIQNPETQKYLFLDTTTNKILWSDLYDDNNKNDNYKISDEDVLPDNFLWIIQHSKYNDIQIKDAIKEKQKVYNSMITQSISNINKNITNKVFKNEIATSEDNIKSMENDLNFQAVNTPLLNYVRKKTQELTINKTDEERDKIEKTFIMNKLLEQKGGILTMNNENISYINNLVKQLKFIKYNDYKLLLNQLNIIKLNSKNSVPSNFGFNKIPNRMLLKYVDPISNTNMSMYIYFSPLSKGSSKFECSIADIQNFRSLEFYVESNEIKNGSYNMFNFNNISIEIDNDTYPEKNTLINDVKFEDRNNLENNIKQFNNILIKFNSVGGEVTKISQIIINLPGIAELIINNTKSNVLVYYNQNPITNNGKWLKPITNTVSNTISDLFRNYRGLSKRNKKIYDFSIKLKNNESKINDINKEDILEYIKKYNNEIGSFYVRKNELEKNIPYTSKIFYISNNDQVLYINIYNTQNAKDVYEAPCNFSSILEKIDISPKEIYEYICKSIFNHIRVVNKKNKSQIINQIFDYITILYKNNKYDKLKDILNISKRTSATGYLLDIINNNLKIEINIKELTDRYELIDSLTTSKIPNSITLVFDELIKTPKENSGKYIYAKIKYTDFIHISNLFTIVPNIAFLNLDSFSREQGVIYEEFCNKIKTIFPNIMNIKNNTDNKNEGHITDIINNMNNIINHYFPESENAKFKKELILYLSSLLNSNINITNYIIDLVLDVFHSIQLKYNEYSIKINELLKNDERFIDCIYRGGNFIDMVYNMINYFSNYMKNNDDFNFPDITRGFYFKNEDDLYVNTVNKLDMGVSSNIKEFLLSFNDIIKYYKQIEKALPEKNIRKQELNQPYFNLLKEFNDNVKNVLKKIFNIKYANIKNNKKPNLTDKEMKEQIEFKKDLIEENKSNFLDYNNINFKRGDNSKIFNKGDVILFKFIRKTKINNLFNTINLFLPYKRLDNTWYKFNELININYKYKNINDIINKKLNIYSILNYNDIFKSKLEYNYISESNLILKDVLPFKNDYSSVKIENICYIKLESEKLYLYLNKYKYEINMKKLINSNLYLIYKTIHNINYYLEYNVIGDTYNYEWVKEESHLLDRLINKLLFINNTEINIDDTLPKVDVTNDKMIEVEYLNRFSLSFSHLNKFIKNDDSDCELLDTYFTIHNKTFRKIINNNNILEILDISLNNSGNNLILKDKYGEINNEIGNYKYHFTTEECNSYIIYCPSYNSDDDDMIILNKNFEFQKVAKNSIKIEDLINNPTVNSDYTINLKYSINKNIFEELNESCIKQKNNKKLIIQNTSEIGQFADKNRYFIYIVDEENGINKGIIDDYYTKKNENIPDKEKACYIIPLKPINKLKILQKNDIKEGTTGEINTIKYLDLNLSLKPIAHNSEYFVIQNVKNEYLRAKDIIQYKKPLRINLEFVETNVINSTYLFTIKNNIVDIESINILKTNLKCLTGGQKIITTNSIKKNYLKEINDSFNINSNFNDLCHNNTHVSFINYNTIETQDDVSYFDCRESCDKNKLCSGFSMSEENKITRCKTYEKKNDTSVSFYDCDKPLTQDNEIGEIKNKIFIKGDKGEIEKKVEYNRMNFIDNTLYYIESKKQSGDKKLYINLNKLYSKFKGEQYDKNYLKCIEIENIDDEDIYSDNIFKLNIQKTNTMNGNIKFYNILSDDKFILGTYNDSLTNINIKYDSKIDRYIWEGFGETWHLKSTNDIYEYIVIEGTAESGFYCPHYKNGYKTMEVTKKNNIIDVRGPGTNDYTRVIPDEDISIFKHINMKTVSSIVNANTLSTYDGNIFVIKNILNKDYYNLFTIFENKKYYIYLDSTNFIDFTLDSEIDNEKYLWKFNLFSNKKNIAHSFQTLQGGEIINQDMIMKNIAQQSGTGSTKINNKNTSEIVGGVSLNKLVNGNSYYIKSENDEYICANKYYKNEDGGIDEKICISINSLLATNPGTNKIYSNKFVRASIDLSDTDYNVYKKYKIDDDIMWKLIIDNNKTSIKKYKFYNIKHNIYLNFGDGNDIFNINTTGASSIFYNILKNDTEENIIVNNQKKNINNVFTLSLSTLRSKNKWAFINPINYNSENPYKMNTTFSNLENGKIYRIINEGVKNNKEVNTYLTINELNNELLIPYNSNLFTNKFEDDISLWKCIINEDNTYSFELVKTGQRLGDISTNLFKNSGNKLNFKNPEYTIDKKYLTDKFYIQHSTNDYYNIINSKNLNYNVCGFSNNNNSYDDYSTKDIKYIHKIANNSEWIITNKTISEYTKTDVFTNENHYYLYPSKTNKIHYSFARTYNPIYNTIYNEENRIETDKNSINERDNKENEIIKFNLNNFKNNKGFTLETEINCKRKSNSVFKKNNISLILETNTDFYTIRFINFSEDSLLIRIIETKQNINENEQTSVRKERYSKIEKINKDFLKLDYINKSVAGNSNKIINMKICAPDVYTNTEDVNIFELDKSFINITYDNEFVNIYINNKLVTYFKKSNLLIKQIYNTSSDNCVWMNIKWWKHRKLLNIPMWKTENIDDFIENKPGIRFKSTVNKNVTIECYVKKQLNNFFYIINNKNEYLSIIGSDTNKLNYETEWTTSNSNDNCLWKLYDTNTNLVKDINLTDGTPSTQDLLKYSFKCLTGTLLNVANIEDENYFDNIDNSTNIMLKAKINDSTKLIDEISNYTYSIIDINPNDENTTENKCYWTHNANGHTSLDYETKNIGSHFYIDTWNIEYILGVTPKIGDKFLVKYKSNKGIIRIDQMKNENYGEYTGIYTTLYARWLNWNKIQDFPNIKSQNNIYIENRFNEGIDSKKVCISKDNDITSPSLYSASCSNVESSNDCKIPPSMMENMENSIERFFIDRSDIDDGVDPCNEYMYKNYKLVKASIENKNIFSENDSIQTGGNIMITEDSKNPPNIKDSNTDWYFYIYPKIDESEIWTNNHNIKYIPSFKKPSTLKDEKLAEEELKNWTYDNSKGSDSRGIIINRILNEFTYDGYIEDVDKKIIRGVILPKNFVLFYTPNKNDISSGYIKGNFKAYNCTYKNIYITEMDYYLETNYINYYLQIRTKNGNKLVKKQNITDLKYKLNKCYDLITNRICIPNGIKSKTASNITNANHLIKNDNIFNEDSQFRILNIYGKYLSDIFINDTQFCEYDSSGKFSKLKSSEIMFKGQSNSIDLVKKSPHHIHNISYESLWNLEKNDNNESYRIRNTYTGRYLINNNNTNTDEIPFLYIEYSQSKYFKQQIIEKTESRISFSNEELYYIYYLDDSKKKIYLSFEDVLVNNKYINSAKYIFIENKPTEFIVKKATRNLNQITDETLDLPKKITNICYNKTKICENNTGDIALFENNNIQCLSISYLFRKKEGSDNIEYNQYNLLNLLNKNNDNFLSITHPGKYEILLFFPNISLANIKFKFSGLFKPITRNSTISFIDVDKISEMMPIQITKLSQIKSQNLDYDKIQIGNPINIIVENSQISKEQTIKFPRTNTQNQLVRFQIDCEQGFTLNYIEAFGTSEKIAPKTENIVTNNSANNFKPIKINKSLISTVKNIIDNRIKLKYIKQEKITESEDTNENENIVDFKDNKPIIRNNNKFLTLIFNPLLNAYMFYIDNNKYLTIENITYFKLILNKTYSKNSTNMYYSLQSLYNPDLYVNVSTSGNLILGNDKPLFQIIQNSEPINTENIHKNTMDINNNFLNNITHNLDDRVIHIQVIQEGIRRDQYFYLKSQSGIVSLEQNSQKKIPLILIRSGLNEWRLSDFKNNSTYIITDLKPTNEDNKYTFKNNGTLEIGYFYLYYNYNELNIRTNADNKKYLSHNDINKKIQGKKTIYEEDLKRNKNYVNKTNILYDIYIHDFISIYNFELEYLTYINGALVWSTNKNEDNYIFIEIRLNNNLCKLWHLSEKKFIIYDTITSKFKLSSKITEYNDIDILNNIDYLDDTNTEYMIFDCTPPELKRRYTLAYYKTEDGPLYLNPNNPTSQDFYNVSVLDGSYTGKYKDTNNIDKHLGVEEEYCKICNSNNSIEDNLLDTKLYQVEDENEDMKLSLGEYKIEITGIIEDLKSMNINNGSNLSKYKYFTIKTNKKDEYIKNLPVKKFKEKNNLKNIFKNINYDQSLKMNIVTIAVNSLKYNLITWENETSKEMIGRFEDPFDVPINPKGNHNIIYDGNNIKLDKTEPTSYIFTTYTNPPKGSYIKIQELPIKFINKFKVGLFHKDNSSMESEEILSDLNKSKKSNTKKLITTCAWGDCEDFTKLTVSDAQDALTSVNQLEQSFNYKQMGGKLDTNMIQFIKNISIKTGNSDYHNKTSETKFVNRKTSYYNKPYLLDILFKKNDIIEFYKVFGKKGWTNSHNSIYSKTMFTINKPINEITDLDYYDSFRNIYPVSWLEKKFAVNLENIWKYNNWFEDNPHFRSLPNWKFELVQAIETRNTSGSKLQIKFGGNMFNKMPLYNFIKNPIIMLIIIIIGIFIVLKVLKKL